MLELLRRWLHDDEKVDRRREFLAGFLLGVVISARVARHQSRHVVEVLVHLCPGRARQRGHIVKKIPVVLCPGQCDGPNAVRGSVGLKDPWQTSRQGVRLTVVCVGAIQHDIVESVGGDRVGQVVGARVRQHVSRARVCVHDKSVEHICVVVLNAAVAVCVDKSPASNRTLWPRRSGRRRESQAC